MFFVLILTKIPLVYSQWYLGEEKQQTTTSIDTEDASKPFPSTSSTQCILKCEIKGMKSFYVADRKECFCLKNETQEILSADAPKMNGMIYKNHDDKVSSFRHQTF